MIFDSIKEASEYFAKQREAEEKAKKPAPKKAPAAKPAESEEK